MSGAPLEPRTSTTFRRLVPTGIPSDALWKFSMLLRRVLSDASTDRAIRLAPGANLLFGCGASRRWLRNETLAPHTRQRSGQATCSAVSASPCEGSKSLLLVQVDVFAVPKCHCPGYKSHKIWLECRRGLLTGGRWYSNSPR